MVSVRLLFDSCCFKHKTEQVSKKKELGISYVNKLVSRNRCHNWHSKNPILVIGTSDTYILDNIIHIIHIYYINIDGSP